MTLSKTLKSSHLKITQFCKCRMTWWNKEKDHSRASLPQLFSERCHKRDEWHVWMSSWGFSLHGANPGSSRRQTSCSLSYISQLSWRFFSPLKSMNPGCSYIYMKILLCLLTNINWILSMLIPASGVWGSLQVHEGWWRGRGDWQEVPSFPASLSHAPVRTAFDENFTTCFSSDTRKISETTVPILAVAPLNTVGSASGMWNKSKKGCFMDLWMWSHRRKLS